MDSAREHRVQLDELEKSLEQALELVRATPRDGLTAIEWLETAAKLGGFLSEARDASSEVRQTLLGGARSALLLYLRGHVGETVPPHALEGVSGIREWARRIRELRAIGWDINCLGAGPSAPYRLDDVQLAEEVAQSQQIIDSIKGSKPKERIIEYLLHLTPWPAGPKQLERVAGVPTWRQEIRDLVDEGWLILSHETDPELAPGFYRLTRLED
ncbi:hypothetical protein GCM10022252_64940 [Streptosporangium oxazolinicum]|uniref:Uncharacterized protein n=1 Tax=Streptosporangium oxazolinicum TaxID=909287 RepID=A0ABP8BEL6_9ACTN